MKKIFQTLAFAFIMLISSLSVSASTGDLNKEKVPTVLTEQRARDIEARVNEINEMDKSQLTRAERKALRGELKALKEEARGGGGIYLSLGAVIIIVLLLIILL